MPRVLISDDFVASTSEVYSDALFDQIFKLIGLLEELPHLGSSDLPRSIKQRFGQGCRKIVVSPFDILYYYDESDDVVQVLELIHQRRIHE